jgi:hypothetical protein
MKCVKCDICGEYVEVWHEVQNDNHKSNIFDYWEDNEIIEIKDICLNCKDKLQKVVEKTILEIKNK